MTRYFQGCCRYVFPEGVCVMHDQSNNQFKVSVASSCIAAFNSFHGTGDTSFKSKMRTISQAYRETQAEVTRLTELLKANGICPVTGNKTAPETDTDTVKPTQKAGRIITRVQ